MNNQSPLLPQGILPEAKNQTRARVKLAVFVVLAIHGVGLLALLLQGCNKPADTTTTQNTQTNEVTPPPFVEPTNAAAPATSTPPPATAQTPPEAAPAAAAGTPTDYKIAAGDNFSTLAKKFHVTTKAIQDANPGIEPTKLQIGQTVHIPAPTAATTTAAATPAGATATPAASGEPVYTVKSGDTLTSIAHSNGTTLRALRAANGLTTDSIKVGQKLKLPPKTTAPATDATTTASTTTTSAPTATR